MARGGPQAPKKKKFILSRMWRVCSHVLRVRKNWQNK